MKVHHAAPLGQRTDCGRRFLGRLVRGDTITCSNGQGLIRVTSSAREITCKTCAKVQP